MRTIDAVLDLRAIVAEVEPACPQLDRKFYLNSLDSHVQRIAERGTHIGAEALQEIRHAILLAYKAGNAE